MSKKEKKRTFESGTLALPPLKMILMDSEMVSSNPSARKTKKKVANEPNEETVMRIISKLSMKD